MKKLTIILGCLAFLYGQTGKITGNIMDTSSQKPLVGVSVIFGFLFIFNAYRYCKPYIVAPFEYVFLIWAVLLGWFIWSETVSLRTIIGILIIVSAGIFILYREKIKEQEITTDQPLR